MPDARDEREQRGHERPIGPQQANTEEMRTEIITGPAHVRKRSSLANRDLHGRVIGTHSVENRVDSTSPDTRQRHDSQTRHHS
jgi:hypothetical protein